MRRVIRLIVPTNFALFVCLGIQTHASGTFPRGIFFFFRFVGVVIVVVVVIGSFMKTNGAFLRKHVFILKHTCGTFPACVAVVINRRGIHYFGWSSQ